MGVPYIYTRVLEPFITVHQIFPLAQQQLKLAESHTRPKMAVKEKRSPARAASSDDENDEPEINYRGIRAMPYIIGSFIHSPIQLLSIRNMHRSRVFLDFVVIIMF